MRKGLMREDVSATSHETVDQNRLLSDAVTRQQVQRRWRSLHTQEVTNQETCTGNERFISSAWSKPEEEINKYRSSDKNREQDTTVEQQKQEGRWRSLKRKVLYDWLYLNVAGISCRLDMPGEHAVPTPLHHAWIDHLVVTPSQPVHSLKLIHQTRQCR